MRVKFNVVQLVVSNQTSKKYDKTKVKQRNIMTQLLLNEFYAVILMKRESLGISNFCFHSIILWCSFCSEHDRSQ